MALHLMSLLIKYIKQNLILSDLNNERDSVLWMLICQCLVLQV